MECWNDCCIVSNCDGVNHIDNEGHHWEEKTTEDKEDD